MSRRDPGTDLDVAIVGAGPYGLSVAAAAPAPRTAVLGRPLATWEAMSPDMALRATWDEMSLGGTDSHGTLEDWVESTGGERREPMTAGDFTRYARWFADRYARVIPNDVSAVTDDAGRFRIEAGNRIVSAQRLVIAVGITPFAWSPPVLRALTEDSSRVRFAADGVPREVAGADVVVVGGGQSAVEAAVQAAGAGARTTVVSRSRIRWFADREPHTPRGRVGGALYRLLYPVVGYGPPPLNRLVTHPDAFAALPASVRRRVGERLLRSGASPSLREAARDVTIREGVGVEGARSDESTVELRLDDGSTIGADLVVVATGYRFSLDRLTWLSSAIRRRIGVTEDGWPVLDRWFRAEDRRIHLVGYPAEGRIGPVARFVLGAPWTARRVAELIAGTR